MMQPEHREMPQPGFLQTIPLSSIPPAQGFTGSEQGTARTRLLWAKSFLVQALGLQLPSENPIPKLCSMNLQLYLTGERTKETFGAQHI